ncbi:MAG: hypothetical protein JOY93_05135 [Acidobacteriales bacterium]|nr:hypothetical protein [Terriglobales bacterium]
MLAHSIEFSPALDLEAFAAVPAAPAVFLLRGESSQAEPYISKTANLRRRLQRLLGSPNEHSRKLSLRDRVRSIEFTATGSDFESGFLLYKLLRSNFPGTYQQRLRLRPPPLVKLHLENAYPRVSITTHRGRPGAKSIYYGPFRSRAVAEKFANDSLDFFKMRRCVDDLHPDPNFPGCIYSEMRMCLAPCFRGCSDGEYQQEVSRVQAYFDSRGESFAREMASQRDAASADLNFEAASAWHAQMAKIKSATEQLPEAVGRIDRLGALMIQPSTVEGCVTFFRIDAAQISDPIIFPIQPGDHTKSHSMESRVQQALALHCSPPCADSGTITEHLALFSRWYYRSSRGGEIFFADEKGALPLRKIVRGISRVYRGEVPLPEITKPGEKGKSHEEHA